MTSSFSGALIGTSSFHPGSGLPTSSSKPLFCFSPARQNYVFSYEKPDKPLFGLLYDPDENAYIVEPYQRRALFLKSGQPLGMNRAYHLPRGSELYIEERKNAFVLG